jgi:hypothetical protein
LKAHRLDTFTRSILSENGQILVFTGTGNEDIKTHISDLLTSDPLQIKLDIYASSRKGKEMQHSILERWTFCTETHKKAKNPIDKQPFDVMYRSIYCKSLLLPANRVKCDLSLDYLIYSHEKPNVKTDAWETYTFLPVIFTPDSSHAVPFKCEVIYRSRILKKELPKRVVHYDSQHTHYVEERFPFSSTSTNTETGDIFKEVVTTKICETFSTAIYDTNADLLYDIGQYSPGDILRPTVPKVNPIEMPQASLLQKIVIQNLIGTKPDPPIKLDDDDNFPKIPFPKVQYRQVTKDDIFKKFDELTDKIVGEKGIEK